MVYASQKLCFPMVWTIRNRGHFVNHWKTEQTPTVFSIPAPAVVWYSNGRNWFVVPSHNLINGLKV